MKKSIAILSVVLSLVLLLCACNVNSDTASTPSTTTTVTNSTPIEESSSSSTGDVSLENLPTLPEITVEIIDMEDIEESEEGATEEEITEEDVVEEDVTKEESAEEDIIEETTPEQPIETPTEETKVPTTEAPTTTTTTQKPTTTTTQKPTTTTQKPTTTTTQKPATTTTQKPTTTTTQNPTNPTYTYTTNQKHTALHYTQRYHYNLLDDDLKAVYARVYNDVSQLKAESDTFYVLPEHEDDWHLAYRAFLADCPEFFYATRSFMGANHSGNKKSIFYSYSIAAYYEDPSASVMYGLYNGGTMTPELKQRIRDKEAAFNKEVQKIISTIPVNAPDVVKEKMAYEAILKTCHYNMQAVTDNLWDGLANDNWTAYGIIVHKKGVCESYAEAFQTLCLQMGINCITVSGLTSGSGHMWNAVELDDDWYMCDITFDDPIGSGAGQALYRYFNRTSQWMRDARHEWEWEFGVDFPTPNCTQTKYEYVNYFGGSIFDDYWTDL